MEVHVSPRVMAGAAVLDVTGELDLYTSPKLKSAINVLLSDGHVHVIVNLLETTYLDSTALSILTAARQHLQGVGGNMGLVYDQPQITRMFVVTGLDQVFQVFSSEAEALETARTWAVAR